MLIIMADATICWYVGSVCIGVDCEELMQTSSLITIHCALIDSEDVCLSPRISHAAALSPDETVETPL